MGYLLTVLSGFSFFKRRDDDDLIDRLHYFLTTNMLIMLSILVSWKQFGGKPIECMVPDQFPHGWEQYAESYCWAQDTYFMPFREEVPVDVSEREDRNISYYQWVPFFLLIQAVFYSLPALTWHVLSGQSGMKIQTLVRAAKEQGNIKPDIRKNTIQVLTVYLENALRFHRRLIRRRVTPHKIFRCLNVPYKACFVTSLYLTVKLFYLTNVVIQFFLMNNFLETNKYHYYGWGALQDMINGTQWQNTGVFPRVTLCDFEVRVMANVQRYTIQCVLIINLFNEKIFIFLWFWYCILAFLTLASFIYWFILLALPYPARWYIIRHLELSEMPFDAKSSEKDVEKFVGSYLRPDGVFVLRMITMHTGIIFGTELVLNLWKSFYGIETEFQRQDSQTNNRWLETPDPFPGNNEKPGILRLRFRKRSKSKDEETETVPEEKQEILPKQMSRRPSRIADEFEDPKPDEKFSSPEKNLRPVMMRREDIERLERLLASAPTLEDVDSAGWKRRDSVSKNDSLHVPSNGRRRPIAEEFNSDVDEETDKQKGADRFPKDPSFNA